MRPEPRKDFELSLDEIAREGARRMLVQALGLEVEDYIESNKDEVDENSRRLVVRNGLSRRVSTIVAMVSGSCQKFFRLIFESLRRSSHYCRFCI